MSWSVLGAVLTIWLVMVSIVALAWRRQWRRDPKRFKDSFRHTRRTTRL